MLEPNQEAHPAGEKMLDLCEGLAWEELVEGLMVVFLDLEQEQVVAVYLEDQQVAEEY